MNLKNFFQPKNSETAKTVEVTPEQDIRNDFTGAKTPRDLIVAYGSLKYEVAQSPDTQLGQATFEHRVQSLKEFGASLATDGVFDETDEDHKTLLSEMRELLFSFEESGFPSDKEASEIENISKWFGMSQAEIKDSSVGDGVVPEFGGIPGTLG